MLVRLSPPGYQVDLWLFMKNGNVGNPERVGRNAIRLEGDEARLNEALKLWHSRNPNAAMEILPDSYSKA